MTIQNSEQSSYTDSTGLLLQHFRIPVVITVIGTLFSAVLFVWSMNTELSRLHAIFFEFSSNKTTTIQNNIDKLVSQVDQTRHFFLASKEVSESEFAIYGRSLIDLGMGHVIWVSSTGRRFSLGDDSQAAAEALIKKNSEQRRVVLTTTAVTGSDTLIHIMVPILKSGQLLGHLVFSKTLSTLVKPLHPHKRYYDSLDLYVFRSQSDKPLYQSRHLKRHSEISKNGTALENIIRFSSVSSKEVLNVFGEQWHLIFTPGKSFLAQSNQFLAWILLVCGLFVTAVLSHYVFRARRDQLRVQEEVSRITKAFKDSELQLTHIINHAVDSLISINDKGIILGANPACERLFGYDLGEMKGQNIRMLMPEPYQSEHDGYLHQYKKTGNAKIIGETRELCARRKNGTIFPMELSVSEIKLGSQRLFSGFIRDVSERKRIEKEVNNKKEQLELTLRRLSLVMDGSNDGFWHWLGPTEDSLECNDHLFHILSYPAQAFSPKFSYVQTLLHADDRDITIDAINQSIETKMPFDIEHRIANKDGRYRWYRSRGTPYYDHQGNLSEMAGSISDIHRTKALEVSLRRSNTELEQFCHIASHDLKEPLRAIRNHCQFLMEDHREKLETDAQSRLDRLMYLSQRMEQLISDLLYFSRLGREELAIGGVDLNAVVVDINETLKDFLEEQNAQVHISSTLPCLRGDKVRITELFRNLIVNGVKYNDSPTKCVEIGVMETNWTTLYVKDNGIGIKSEYYEEIFLLFKRLNNKKKYGDSTGSGLTFVKKIMQQHNGDVWLESEPGSGTTFYLQFRESEQQ